MALLYDGHMIIGGNPATKVSPNFSLREVTRKNGTVRVHRETVAALQILRDRFTRSIKVTAMRPQDGLGQGRDGLFAWLDPTEDPSDLNACAGGLADEGIFAEVRSSDAGLYVCIPDPAALPPVAADAALVTAIRVTSGFETAGDPFQQVTGNFDGAGLSFGPSQVNFGTGTLTPLFNRFIQADVATLKACFGGGTDYDKWRRVLRSTRKDRVAWADSVSTGPNKKKIAAPWNGYLRAVGRVPAFRQLMTDFAREKYGAKLARALRWLQDAGDLQIDRLRCVCSVYDLCTQQGSLDKAHSRIKQRIAAEAPGDQVDLVQIAVEERGKKANPPWRADCVSRRVGILFGKPMPAAVEDERKTRSNRYFYLLRDVAIADPDSLL